MIFKIQFLAQCIVTLSHTVAPPVDWYSCEDSPICSISPFGVVDDLADVWQNCHAVAATLASAGLHAIYFENDEEHFNQHLDLARHTAREAFSSRSGFVNRERFQDFLLSLGSAATDVKNEITDMKGALQAEKQAVEDSMLEFLDSVKIYIICFLWCLILCAALRHSEMDRTTRDKIAREFQELLAGGPEEAQKKDGKDKALLAGDREEAQKKDGKDNIANAKQPTIPGLMMQTGISILLHVAHIMYLCGITSQGWLKGSAVVVSLSLLLSIYTAKAVVWALPDCLAADEALSVYDLRTCNDTLQLTLTACQKPDGLDYCQQSLSGMPVPVSGNLSIELCMDCMHSFQNSLKECNTSITQAQPYSDHFISATQRWHSGSCSAWSIQSCVCHDAPDESRVPLSLYQPSIEMVAESIDEQFNCHRNDYFIHSPGDNNWMQVTAWWVLFSIGIILAIVHAVSSWKKPQDMVGYKTPVGFFGLMIVTAFCFNIAHKTSSLKDTTEFGVIQFGIHRNTPMDVLCLLKKNAEEALTFPTLLGPPTMVFVASVYFFISQGYFGESNKQATGTKQTGLTQGQQQGQYSSPDKNSGLEVLIQGQYSSPDKNSGLEVLIQEILSNAGESGKADAEMKICKALSALLHSQVLKMKLQDIWDKKHQDLSKAYQK